MKRILILTLALFTVALAKAQFVGDFNITRKVLCEENGELHVVLGISVSRHAVTRDQSWIIIPEVCTADRRSTKMLPYVLINGPYQRHMLERRRVLTGSYWAERAPYMVINADKKTDQQFNYEMKVPFESWMSNATLVIRQIQQTPGGRRRVFSVDVNGAVETQHP